MKKTNRSNKTLGQILLHLAIGEKWGLRLRKGTKHPLSGVHWFHYSGMSQVGMVIFVMNGALLEVIIEMGRRFLLFMVFATKVGGLVVVGGRKGKRNKSWSFF